MLEQTVSWIMILKGFSGAVVTFGGLYAIITSMRKAQDKYATKDYVNKEIKRVEKETDLKVELIKQSNEEIHSLLEHIVSRVDVIYEKHFKTK